MPRASVAQPSSVVGHERSPRGSAIGPMSVAVAVAAVYATHWTYVRVFARVGDADLRVKRQLDSSLVASRTVQEPRVAEGKREVALGAAPAPGVLRRPLQAAELRVRGQPTASSAHAVLSCLASHGAGGRAKARGVRHAGELALGAAAHRHPRAAAAHRAGPDSLRLRAGARARALHWCTHEKDSEHQKPFDVSEPF